MRLIMSDPFSRFHYHPLEDAIRRMIRDVMGHRLIQTTERYAHATDEGKRRAVEAIHTQSKKIVTKLSQRKAANR